MDDINFDELDQAVNSAMKPADNDTATASSPPAAEDKVAQIVDKAPVSAEPVVASVASPVKRRCQFMDIVHSTNSRPAYAPPVNRHSSTIKPLDPELIKVGGEVPANPVDLVEAPTLEPVAADSVAVEAEPPTEPNSLVTTPFVEGVPVEKRPLGAFADNETPSDESTDSVTAQAEAAVEEPSVSSEAVTEAVDEEISSPDEVVPVELDKSEPAEQLQDFSSEANSYSVPAMPDEGTAQSIPQQYHVNNSFSSDEEHAVFDTSQYHQPLLPPSKPRHGRKALLYVLLVILMLAIGSAAGYAIFVLKLF